MGRWCADRFFIERDGFLSSCDHCCTLPEGHDGQVHTCVPCNFSWARTGVSGAVLERIEARIREGGRWISRHPLTGDWRG